jgi:hypothetical protein
MKYPLVVALTVALLLAGCLAPPETPESAKPRWTWGTGGPVADGFVWEARFASNPEEEALLTALVEHVARDCGGEAPEVNLSGGLAATTIMWLCKRSSDQAISYTYGGAGDVPLRGYLVEAEAGFAALFPRLALLNHTGMPMVDIFLSQLAWRAISVSGYIETSKQYSSLYSDSRDLDHLDHAYLNALSGLGALRNLNIALDHILAEWPSCAASHERALTSLEELVTRLQFAMEHTEFPAELSPPIGAIQGIELRGANLVLEHGIGAAADPARRVIQFRINYYEAYAEEQLPTMGEAYYILNQIAATSDYPLIVPALMSSTQVEPEVENVWYTDPRLAMRVLAAQRMSYESLSEPCG